MAEFMTALTAAVNAEALWGVLASIVPFIGVLVLFALGVHFIRRGVSGAAKGKAKL